MTTEQNATRANPGRTSRFGASSGSDEEGGGAKSGLARNRTDPTRDNEMTDQQNGSCPADLVVFYMECRGADRQSFGLGDFFQYLAHRNQSTDLGS